MLVIANSSAAASGVIATTATGTREIVRASGPGSVVPAICMTAIVGTSRDGDQWLWTHVARGRAVLPSKKWLTLLMKIVSGPEVVQRPEIPYVAFRDRIPFKGFATHTAAMHAELARWLHQHPVDTTGPQFLRLHVIDLSDRATVSVAIPVASVDVAAQAVEADEDPRMVADAIPAGRYATLTYVNHGVKANLTLTRWCAAQGLEIERLRDTSGNTFAARLETLLTDPAQEPRVARQRVRLDFKIAD